MAQTQTETKASLQDRIDELEETIEQIGDKADDALDPECTREELVGYLKDIADLAAGEEPDEDEDEDEDDSMYTTFAVQSGQQSKTASGVWARQPSAPSFQPGPQ